MSGRGLLVRGDHSIWGQGKRVYDKMCRLDILFITSIKNAICSSIKKGEDKSSHFETISIVFEFHKQKENRKQMQRSIKADNMRLDDFIIYLEIFLDQIWREEANT